MKKLSKIIESVWSDLQDRGSGKITRKEDLPEKNPQYWWRDIPHPDAPKYKKDELRGFDIIYNFVISKIEKALNIEWPDEVRVYFSDEPYWYLSLEHVTPYGSDTYTIKAWGTKGGYNPESWSEMLMPAKRGIRYRLEKRKLYLYPGNPNGGKIRDFVVRDIDEFKGKKGIELK